MATIQSQPTIHNLHLTLTPDRKKIFALKKKKWEYVISECVSFFHIKTKPQLHPKAGKKRQISEGKICLVKPNGKTKYWRSIETIFVFSGSPDGFTNVKVFFSLADGSGSQTVLHFFSKADVWAFGFNLTRRSGSHGIRVMVRVRSSQQ